VASRMRTFTSAKVFAIAFPAMIIPSISGQSAR
jgi:hypothetical protein